ncbi:AAA family ATPase [Spirosoma validum]|uniref:AAA family ATPase n=1 Tax=Spirosoma validum TaxID=2771355 RepID=A0A927GB51_9BACT|nr:AAA family ATPase [Spirosoma validum]MBD2751388.1 AAA family ATPase [Spirosoma validum]
MNPKQKEKKSTLNAEFEIQAKNIGPHINLYENFKTHSVEICLFANNGTGKTVLSRIFRLATKDNPSKYDSNKLLTLGENKGSFSFSVKNISNGRNDLISTINVDLQRNVPPVITGQKTYIYHIFNEDYVSENLAASRYKPNGEIKGYIIGKEKIDISKEKLNLESFTYDLSDSYQLIEAEIKKARFELKGLGINEKTSEFSYLNINSLIESDLSFSEEETYEELKNKLFTLNSIPDNLSDLYNCNLSISTNTLFLIQDYLETPFNKSAIAESFKEKIRSKSLFIEDGLKILGTSKETCPFCEQDLNASALDLIDKYVEFTIDTENKQIKHGDNLINYLEDLENQFQALCNDFLVLKSKYQEYKRYLPSIDNELIDILYPDDVRESINAIKKMLHLKVSDISKSYGINTYGEHIDCIDKCVIEFIRIININKSLVNLINSRKDNKKSEKLELNRKIIKAKYNSLKNYLSADAKKCYNLRLFIELLGEDIKDKEESERVDKKSKVAETFQYYLKTFFQGKYYFDENEFCLTYKNNKLNQNASDVLSEGEKTIVAFCYYLADIHKIVNNSEDYKLIFLIIDDPISSLDFHYVYAIAQVIKNFTVVFQVKFARYIILTHNFEFLSILLRNNLSFENFILSSGKIKAMRKGLVMPYEEHLNDIYNVAQGNMEPSHTTPNSIRHILETINRFVSPDVDFLDFYGASNILNDCRFLYTLMHDNSHGNIRVQKPYTDEMIVGGCKTVINFIEASFKGQLKNLQ